jgi:hypothetical protein
MATKLRGVFELMPNPERPIDRAFAKIWAAYEADKSAEAQAIADGKDSRWSYSNTRVAILAAVQVAANCDDSITTQWCYAPGSNEIVARLRSIGIPTAENIKYAQEAVRPAMGWEERLEQLIRIGANV